MSQRFLTAAEAKKLCDRNKVRAEDVNLRLVFSRLMKIIESTARQGRDCLEFEAPSFVLDGSVADPLQLAKDLSEKLSSLGYQMTRREHVLWIQW
jgi:hypothetical protein